MNMYLLDLVVSIVCGTVEATYITGHPSRLRRRRAVPLRFPPCLWNAYDLVDGRKRTNNVPIVEYTRYTRNLKN